MPAPRVVRGRFPSEAPIVTGSTQELGVYLFQQAAGQPRTGRTDSDGQHGRRDRDRARAGGRRHGGPATGETLIAPTTPIDDNPHSIPVVGTRNPRQKEYPET